MWVRGLKHFLHTVLANLHIVAPYVGAWIETVALASHFASVVSHPMWVRGLKRVP